MKDDTTLLKVIRVISPVIIYEIITFGITFIVSLFLTAYIDIPLTGDGSDQMLIYDMLMDKVIGLTMVVTLLSACVAIIFSTRMMHKDDLRRDYRIIFRSIPLWVYIVSAVIGVCVCIGINSASELSRIRDLASGVDTVNEVIYSSPEILRFLTVGVVAPIAEELIFRGLIYRRLRDYTNLALSLVISCFIFGLYHGNLVQGLYGFLLGIVFALLYEKTGFIMIPIIGHVVANVTSLSISMVLDEWPPMTATIIMMIITIVVALLLLWLVWKKVSPKIEYLELFDNNAGQG